MHVYPGSFRRAGSCLIAITAILLIPRPGPAQSKAIERSFPTEADPRVIVSNATNVTIDSWNKNEIALVADVAGDAGLPDEIRIKADKNKLEISCHPAKPDRVISVQLRVPAKASLEVKSAASGIHVMEPTGQITIRHTSKAHIEIQVPQTTALDMEQVGVASARRPLSPAGYAIHQVGGRKIGTGPPFVRVVAAKALVSVFLGSVAQMAPRRKSPTMAAQTIARRGGLMGEALRRSHPQLIRPRRVDPATDAASGKGPANTEEEELKLETHLVNLNVAATDRAGRAVEGLKPEDFSIYEDGALQKISFFSPERSPFNLVLLLDLSGSMRDEIELIKDTAQHFLNVISPQDSVALVTFSTDVTVVSHLTKDREDLRDSIDYMLPPLGGTSFYDALAFTLVEILRKVKGQRNVVVAITDGEDNRLQPQIISRLPPGLPPPPPVGSFLTFDELLDGAKEADAVIYPIRLNPALPQLQIQFKTGTPIKDPAFQKSPATEVAKQQLQDLAEASGGRVYHANRIEDLKGVFEQVAAELRSVYSMAYNPTNQSFDGKFRRIRIRANKPEVVTRTRPGYYAR